MSKKRSFYYFKAAPLDTAAILAIQIENIEQNIESLERGRQGFLSFALSERSLHSCMKLNLVRGAMRRKNHRFTGFVAGMPASSATYVPWVLPTIDFIRSSFSYPCFLQLCVEKQNRRKGIGTNLLNQIKFEARKQQFNALISVVQKDNTPGVLFLLQQGFSVLQAPFSDRAIFYLEDDF